MTLAEGELQLEKFFLVGYLGLELVVEVEVEHCDKGYWH